MKDLLEINNFGAIDADNDDILYDCFEDHEAFIQLLEFKKFLIVGRKGSGKTAIFKKLLTMKSFNLFSFGHTFSDYPWHYHDRQARIGIPDHDKYTHSWKYLILLTLSKIILNQDNSVPFDDQSMEDMIRVEKFVIDTYGTRDPDITQIFTPSKTLKLKPTFQLDWKILKAGISPESVPMAELPSIIQEVNLNLQNYVLNCLNPGNRYYVCFDQLDLGFDPNNAEYSNRLIGLLLACRDFNLRAKEHKKNLFVSIFLRNDIYDNLHFEDKNKITENFLSLIEWDTPRTIKSLKGLMEKRFNRLLEEKLTATVKWEDIFDETKEMSGHQTKYQHIIDRTYLRPRDIIKFCNEVLSQYKNRRTANTEIPRNAKIENIDINSAKTEYGNYFLNELDDEIHKHIPNYRNYLEIFKALGVLQFAKEEFISAFESRKTLFTAILDPISILKELFEFSVIGYYKVGGRGYGGSEYIYKYKDSRSQFDENAPKFRLHPGLMEVLGLRKYTLTPLPTIK
jgi:hypothetical protein